MNGRRRRIKRVLLMVMIVVAVAIGIASVAAARYNPLQHGNSALDMRDASDKPRPLYRDGETASFGFTIANNGRWGVTIVELPGLHQGKYPFRLLRFERAELSDTLGFTGPFRAFTPFALRPGEQVAVLLTGRFADCEQYAAGSVNGFEFIDVRYRFLGILHTAEIPLMTSVAVESPPDPQCPRPRRVQQGEPLSSPTPSG